MMSLSTSPRTGRWIDHSNHHRLQTLETDFGATWYKIGVAIILTLSTPYVFRIVARLFSWMFSRKSRTAARDNEEAESQNLLIPDMLKTSRSSREITTKVIKNIYGRKSSLETRHRFFMFFVVSVLLLTIYGQVIVGALLTERIQTNRSALLKSDYCGLYEYDNERAGEEEAARADMWMVERERRAAAYAQECYNYDTSKKGKAMRCDFFYNSTIGYTRIDDKCPFDKPEVCVDGYQERSAVTFDTGLVDSSILGINHESTHKFRRTTTCAPLSANRPYVWHFSNSPEDHGYLYYYGSLYDTTNCSEPVHAPPQPISNYTMRIAGHPFEWQAPVYRVNIYPTSLLDSICDFYQPIPDLQAPGLLEPRTKTLSIIFVTGLHILYTKPSNDPIFPADKAFRYPGDTRDYYMNSSPKARSFACIDETQFCAPSGWPCWHYNQPIPAGASNTSAYWFMKYAMKNSNTYDSIKLRLGSGLLAQQMVGQSRSRPLADNHWSIEAEHLFRTSLARAQFDAWSIASGEDHDIKTYTDTLPDEAREKVCGLFKFNSVGHVNILVWPFVWLMLTLPITFVFSLEWKTIKRSVHRVSLWVKRGFKKSPQGAQSAHSTTTTPPIQTPGSVFTVASHSSSRRASDAQAVEQPVDAEINRSDAPGDMNSTEDPQRRGVPIERTPLEAHAGNSRTPRNYGSITGDFPASV